MLNAVHIDVVIPCIEKDLPTLELSIEAIRKYGKDVRRIIVVSNKRLTDKAEWFDETQYPMQKKDVARLMYGVEDTTLPRVGWIYQQLLKLYAPQVIPDISENVLLLDSDTVFLRPVQFIRSDGVALYNVGTEYYPAYFEHIQRLLPGTSKVFPQYSGICHHMLIQKEIIDEIFSQVEAIHGIPFWEAVVRLLDKEELKFSEYELYFNYVFAHHKKVDLRFFRWANISKIYAIGKYSRRKFHYVSIHEWMREGV